jgi:hypothetical protein
MSTGLPHTLGELADFLAGGGVPESDDSILAVRDRIPAVRGQAVRLLGKDDRPDFLPRFHVPFPHGFVFPARQEPIPARQHPGHADRVGVTREAADLLPVPDSCRTIVRPNPLPSPL